MKKIFNTLMIASAIALSFSYAQADEVVFCVSQEDNYAVLMDAKGHCLETEEEHSISGSGIKRSEDSIPLVKFSENTNCKDDSTGTKTQVGFDKNGDGILGGNEVLSSSGSCSEIRSIADE